MIARTFSSVSGISGTTHDRDDMLLLNDRPKKIQRKDSHEVPRHTEYFVPLWVTSGKKGLFRK
jgi:hypothetical protein